MQRLTALFVDDITLGVHHIVIFQQTLAHAVMVLLHLALCTLNGSRNHGTLNHFAFLESHLVHHACNLFRTEQTHQLILKRQRIQMILGHLDDQNGHATDGQPVVTRDARYQ